MNVALGAKDEDTLTSLANRIIRLNARMTPSERKTFKRTVGKSADRLSENLLNAFDMDVIEEKAKRDSCTDNPTEEQLSTAKTELIKAATEPFHDPGKRDYIENLRRSHDQIIDNINLDHVTYAGFDSHREEKADGMITSFREFIEENKDEIIALRIIYDQAYKDRTMVIEDLKALYERLKTKGITVERLWDSYTVKRPEGVKTGTVAQLTDLISIIRFEMGYTENLAPFAETVNYNFMQWTLRKNAGAVHFSEEQMEWLRLIKEHIITSLSIVPSDLDLTPFDRRGGLSAFYDAFGDDYEKILMEMNEELVA